MGSYEKNDDYRQVADRAEHEADELARWSESLGEQLKEVRRSWERKRADRAVPGANPPDSDREERARADRGRGDAAETNE